MKSIGVREAKDHFTEWLKKSQREAVVVMRHGRPAAMVIGMEGVDPADIALAEFHRRRATVRHRAISGEELVRRLKLDPAEVEMWKQRAQAEVDAARGGFNVGEAAGLPSRLTGKRAAAK